MTTLDEEAYKAEFLAEIGSIHAGTNCFTQGWDRAKQLYDDDYELGIASYAGFIKFLVCKTEKENCGSGSLSSFSCGITNGLLQELDWVALLEGEGITKKDIADLILCVKDSYPIGGSVEDNPELYKILFKCITGVELGDLGSAIKDFIFENWDESYYQGQATAFVVTLLSPYKGKIIEKLRNLPKYASKIAKFESLATAKNAEELVSIANSLRKLGKTLTVKPSWLPNRTIVGNLDNPKGLIGVYNKTMPDGSVINDTKRVIEELDYPQTFASTFEASSKDGYKILNTNKWYYQDGDQYWGDFNKPWLDELVNKKADVVVLSDKSNDLLRYQLNPDFSYKTLNGQRVKSGFGKEIDYMENLVSQGKYQWDAVNGIYKYVGD
jgi:hypothetical protein